MKLLRLTVGYVLLLIVALCIGVLILCLLPLGVLLLCGKWLLGCMVEALDRGMR